MLELDEGQLSRPVLRGRGGSNTSLLPGQSVAGNRQRGRVYAQPDPAGGARSVRRENEGRGRGMLADIVSQPRFPLLSEQRKAHSCVNADMRPNRGKMPRKRGKTATFERISYVPGYAATHLSSYRCV